MKRIGITLLIMLGAFSAKAQLIDSVFYNVPEDLLPLIESNARLDMLDLYNYGMTARAENIFSGTSQMLVKKPDFIRLRLTDVSEWELKILPSPPDTILCIVHTLKGVAGSSKVTFYGNNWRQLEMTIPELKVEDFWATTDSLPEDKRKEWSERLSPLAVEAHWSEQAPKLTYTLSLAPLNSAEREEVAPHQRSRIYGWVEGRFVAMPD